LLTLSSSFLMTFQPGCVSARASAPNPSQIVYSPQARTSHWVSALANTATMNRRSGCSPRSISSASSRSWRGMSRYAPASRDTIFAVMKVSISYDGGVAPSRAGCVSLACRSGRRLPRTPDHAPDRNRSKQFGMPSRPECSGSSRPLRSHGYI